MMKPGYVDPTFKAYIDAHNAWTKRLDLGIKHPEQVARTPDLFAEYQDLPPGPAFVFYKGKKPEDCEGYRFLYKVPHGYLWQDATDWTGAGWVRPKGK